METRTATDAASSVPDMIEHAIKGVSTVITKNGKPKAVVVPVGFALDHVEELAKLPVEAARWKAFFEGGA